MSAIIEFVWTDFALFWGRLCVVALLVLAAGLVYGLVHDHQLRRGQLHLSEATRLRLIDGERHDG